MENTVMEKEEVKTAKKNGKAVNNQPTDINLSVNPSEIKAVVSQLNTAVKAVNDNSIRQDSRETTIIINPVNKGNLLNTLEHHIGSDCLEELRRLIKFKGHDISKIDYIKIIELLNFITIESNYDKTTNERLKILIEMPNSKDYEKSIKAYYNLFPEGFIIVCDKAVDEDFGDIIYELDTLKISYVWKSLIDEIADFAGVEKNYGCGLMISDNINFKYHQGYFLFNPVIYFEMDWDECIVDILFNTVDLFTQHIGLYSDVETFKSKYINFLKAILVKRLNTKDIYNKTKEVTRKKKSLI